MTRDAAAEEISSCLFNVNVVIAAQHCCKSSLSLAWPTTIVCRCRIEQGRVIVARPWYPPRLRASRIRLFSAHSALVNQPQSWNSAWRSHLSGDIHTHLTPKVTESKPLIYPPSTKKGQRTSQERGDGEDAAWHKMRRLRSPTFFIDARVIHFNPEGAESGQCELGGKVRRS